MRSCLRHRAQGLGMVNIDRHTHPIKRSGRNTCHLRGLPPTVRGTPQDGPVLRYAVQKGGGAPPRRNRPDGCHSKSTSISLSRGHPFAKIGGAYIATAMRSLLCGGCHAKSSCRHRAGCTLAEYVAPCIRRWPTVRHGQPHKGAGRTTWAPISKAMAAWEETGATHQ